MNLDRLVKAYRKNAEEVLSNPKNHSLRTLQQAHVILRIDLRRRLEQLAREFGGCLSCIQAEPHPKLPCDLTARRCELGLRQEDCGKWKSILEAD